MCAVTLPSLGTVSHLSLSLGAGPVQLAGSPEFDAPATTHAGCGGASM